MTSQQRADEYLNLWRLLRLQGVPAQLRLPMIDALAEIERAKAYPIEAISRRGLVPGILARGANLICT